jgi:hypothetical protein
MDQLVELDLSGFFQAVVDKTVQLICTQHLSKGSVTTKHLEKVITTFCYKSIINRPFLFRLRFHFNFLAVS